MIIRAEQLTKTFRRAETRPGLLGGLRALVGRRGELVTAVDRVSFEVPSGAKTAYVGPNGAGKSTTIKMLTGVVTPTSGRCTVGGIEPYRERRRNARHIGVVFGQRSQLWWDLSVPDSFRILQRIYEIPQRVYRRNLARFRDLLDIDALGNTRVRELSLGQRMRSEIAASLLHDPAVVFWDEPTMGLDPAFKRAVHELLNQANRELGTTVLLTSHDLNDISAICDQALVLDHGKVIHQGSLRLLLGRAATRSVLFDHGGPQSTDETVRLVEAILPGVTATPAEGGRITVQYPVARLSAREVLTALLAHFEVTDCYAPEPELADVLRDIYAAARDGDRVAG